MRPVLASRPTEHVVAFYHSDDFVVEQVASFISEGLAANEHVIAIATALHWNAITARLDESGIAYGRATSAGQLVLIEADEALDAVTVDGKVSVERFRAMLAPLVKPGARTRIYGELVSLLAQRGDVDAAVAIERLGHELAHAQDVRVLCGYHVDGARPLTTAEIARIKETHDRSVVEDTFPSPGLGRDRPRQNTVSSTPFGSTRAGSRSPEWSVNFLEKASWRACRRSSSPRLRTLSRSKAC